MNTKQRIVLAIGLLLFLTASLAPAYEGVFQAEEESFKYSLGHHLVFFGPTDEEVLALYDSQRGAEAQIEDNGNDWGEITSYIVVPETVLELVAITALTIGLMVLFYHSKIEG